MRGTRHRSSAPTCSGDCSRSGAKWSPSSITKRCSQRVIEAARELTGARYGALGVLDESRRELDRFLTSRDRRDGAPRDRRPSSRPRHPRRPHQRSAAAAPDRCRPAPGLVRLPRRPPADALVPRRPVLVRGEAWGNLYLTEKEGGAVRRGRRGGDRGARRWAAMAIHNAHLYRSEQAQRAELERAVPGAGDDERRSPARIGTETDLDRVLELIVKRGRALVEATRGALCSPRATSWWPGGGRAGRRAVLGVPVAGSAVGHVFTRTRRAHLRRQSLLIPPGSSAACLDGAVVPLIFRSRRSASWPPSTGSTASREFATDDGR